MKMKNRPCQHEKKYSIIYRILSNVLTKIKTGFDLYK